MLRRHFNETRVGRIPTGYAVLEAEAVEYTPEDTGVVAQDIGTTIALHTVVVDELPQQLQVSSEYSDS